MLFKIQEKMQEIEELLLKLWKF